eukprot:UN23837
MTCVIEVKWKQEKDIVVVASGFLIGDLSSKDEGVVKKTKHGYTIIKSKWVITAGHVIYNDKHGMCDEIRIRMPNVANYHKHRVRKIPYDGKDPDRNKRFTNCKGTPMIHPTYQKSPDPFGGADLGLIKLDSAVQRVGLPIRIVEDDWKPDVLTVGGYPGQQNRAYHLHVSSSRYKNI